MTPDPDPPIEVAQDTFVYEPRATYEWCQAALKNDGRDPLVADLVFKQRRMIRENGYDISGPYSLTHSFLLAALRHGNPYASGHRETFTIPRFIDSDYGNDPDFAAYLRRVKATGIPYVIAHLPIYTEVVQGIPIEFIARRQQLWESLERHSGRKIHPLYHHFPKPLDRPERMNAAPDNFHPSHFGMELYAKAIADVLGEEGLLASATGPRNAGKGQ